MSARDAMRVAVMLFDRAPMFEAAVPISVFGVDRSDTGAPRFDLRVVAAEPGPLTTTGGLRLDAPYELDTLDGAGTVVVPSWRDPGEPPPARALEALRTAHADGATIAGLCLGAFVLAAAGLLEGRRAATHWLYAPTLAAAHPDVRVDPTVLYVDHGDVLTSAGTAAGIDACLHLVRRRHGAQAATAIARRMVVPPHRTGGQSQYIEHPVPERADDDPLVGVLDHAVRHLDHDIDVDTLAGRAHLSRRTFDHGSSGTYGRGFRRVICRRSQ
jgi:transcriptional regulator GlxA family with amidase domain